jgi:ankyrin repeat protein
MKGDIPIIQLFLNTGQVEVNSIDDYGRTPLFWAASLKRKAVAKLLFGTGKASVDGKDDSGRMLLLSAIRNRDEELWAGSRHKAAAKLLLARGKAGVDGKDNSGRLLLWSAIRKRDEDVVELLLAIDRAKAHEIPLLLAAKLPEEEIKPRYYYY